MKLDFRNDDNVTTSPKEPGSYFNGSDSVVLLRLPEMAELRQLWHQFDRELRSQLKDLLLQPYGEIVEKLGSLGFRVGNAEERSLPGLKSWNHMSTSVNAVYRRAVEHAGETVKRRPEAHLFVNGARLAKIGVDAFNWTLKPTPFNTQVASRLLGEPVFSVPPHVKSWAAQLREIMPLFEHKTIKL